jgi:hypothetical protein
VNYSNEKANEHFEKAISYFAYGKHQNECVNYSNEKANEHFEKAISYFAD